MEITAARTTRSSATTAGEEPARGKKRKGQPQNSSLSPGRRRRTTNANATATVGLSSNKKMKAASKQKEEKPSVAKSQEEEEEEDVCCICLDVSSKAEVASINNCQHLFCFTCISSWADRENTCPSCKARFTSIRRVHKNEFSASPDSKRVRNRTQKTEYLRSVAAMLAARSNRNLIGPLLLSNIELTAAPAFVDLTLFRNSSPQRSSEAEPTLIDLTRPSMELNLSSAAPTIIDLTPQDASTAWSIVVRSMANALGL